MGLIFSHSDEDNNRTLSRGRVWWSRHHAWIAWPSAPIRRQLPDLLYTSPLISARSLSNPQTNSPCLILDMRYEWPFCQGRRLLFFPVRKFCTDRDNTDFMGAVMSLMCFLASTGQGVKQVCPSAIHYLVFSIFLPGMKSLPRQRILEGSWRPDLLVQGNFFSFFLE